MFLVLRWWVKIMKKYNLRCPYCGQKNIKLKFWLYLKLIIKGSIRSQCKNCSKQSRYILISHIVHDVDSDERLFNKEVERVQSKVRSMRGLK